MSFHTANKTLGLLVAQTVKNQPAVQEIWVWFLGWEDRLEKEKATHSNFLAGIRGAWWATAHGVSESNMTEWISLSLLLYHVLSVVGILCCFHSVQSFVVSDSVRPHGLQHARLPCPSSTPGACSNSSPSSRWYHSTISSSVIPFSSCPQSFPASGSFLMSWLFASGGQSIGVSASTSVLPMNIQNWFPLGLTDLIFLQSKGLSRVFSNTTVQKHQFFNT